MQNVEVTPEIARRIFTNADAKGVSVEIYLQTVISNSQKNAVNDEPPLSELLENLTGKIDSSQPDAEQKSSTTYGKALAEKFEKQGLKMP